MSRYVRMPSVLAVVLTVALAHVAHAFDLKTLSNASDEWLRSAESRRIADNVVSWQNADGGWWKEYDYDRPRRDDDHATVSGFDNGATHTETGFLARAYSATGDDRYRAAFDRAFRFILDSQMPNGGWPQHVPAGDGYARHITFNDDAMTSVMALLKDVVEGRRAFAFVSDDDRQRAQDAFDRGVECILACQIVVDGQLTGWCAQHDSETLAPAGARSYELPSISGSEGARIVLLLMSIEHPDDRVKRAVRSAVAWFERSKIEGKRLERRAAADVPGGTDLFLIDDPTGEPLWARFYDIETNQPFYCDRDGVKKPSLDQIGHERRNGYAWIRPFGKEVLEAYPQWVAKHSVAD